MQRTGSDRRRVISCVILIALFILLVILDQTIKILIKRADSLGVFKPITVIDGFFYITYTKNSGAAWSFLSGQDWAQLFFKALTLVAIIVFILMFVYTTKKNKRFMRFAFVLISAGAVGNFIDRVAYGFEVAGANAGIIEILKNGYVVDFLSFVFGSYSFPVFNIADALMTVGMVLLIIDLLFIDEDAVFKKKKA